MTKIVALSPSNQNANTWTDGTTEEFHAVELANMIQIRLERADCKVLRADSVKPFGVTPCRINHFQDADCLVMLHTNAFDGKTRGMRLFAYQAYASDGVLASNNGRLMRSIKLAADLLNMTPAPRCYYDFASWGELTNADRYNIPACYVESIFHDNEEEVKWYYTHMDELADAIAGGILEYLDMPKVDDGSVYKIQLGAWKDKKLAEQALAKLQEAGSLMAKAIIVKE